MGKFFIGHNSIQPTILLSGYKALGGVTVVDAVIGLALTTLLSIKPILKLAPLRYTKPTAVAP